MAARTLARWERVQRACGAATYAGYPSDKSFLAAVANGEMPPPFKLHGADAWDIQDLDVAIDALKAGAKITHDWRKRAPARV